MPTPGLKAAAVKKAPAKKAPAMMVNKSPVLARSAEEHPEEGSGTVLALTIIAALLVVTVVIAGLIGVVFANRRASAAADLSALAAADAYRGLTEGDPCAVAADLAERHGAHLESCTFPDRPETVEVTVAVPVAGPMGVLGPARVRARAGAEHIEEERAKEGHAEEEDAAGNAEEVGNAEELSPAEVAELEEELETEQDSAPESPSPPEPPEPESPADQERPAEPENPAKPENPAD